MTDADGAAGDGGKLPPETAVGRAALIVNDLDSVSEFYRDVVGLAVQACEGGRATLGAGGDPLLELTADPGAPDRPGRSAGLFHTAFRVPSRAALGDALARIEGRWELTGASDHHVSEALYLDDPEGNGVEVYRDRPREEWPTDERGRVEMDTLPLDLEALAADAGDEPSAPPGTDVGHVHLEVSDVAAARRFYVGTLGMNVRQEWGPDALFVAAGDYHHHVGLNTWNRRSEPPAGRGLDWFELLLPDEASLAAARERFEAAGVEIGTPGTRIDGGATDEGTTDEGTTDEGTTDEGTTDEGTTDEGFEVRDPDGIPIRLRIERA
jgi:catechol 2,3-dioxygenase